MLLFFIAAVCMMSSVLPVFAETAEQENGFAKDCKAAYVCDWHSGSEVYAKDAKKHLPIASMCKIMTLIVCFDEVEKGNLKLSEEIPVSETASGMGGSQVFLEAGGLYKAEDLIKSICIASANDSCVAMAERLSGSEEVFVRKMNERAKNLGMEDTFFVNCTGLPKQGQYSCARDVAIMLSELLHHQEYFAFSKIWMDTIRHKGDRVTEMANTNKMIRTYHGCDAGKTGYTAEAGFCLAASALRGNMRVVSVVIGAKDSKSRFEAVKEMFDYVFANYTSKAVLEEGVLKDVRCIVKGGKKKEIAVCPARAGFVFCKRDDTEDIFWEASTDSVKAPVVKGQRVGCVTIYKNNIEIDTIDLLANESVLKSGYFDSLRELAQNWNY